MKLQKRFFSWAAPKLIITKEEEVHILLELFSILKNNKIVLGKTERLNEQRDGMQGPFQG